MPVDMADLFRGDKVMLIEDRRGRRKAPRMAIVLEILSQPNQHGQFILIKYVDSGWYGFYLAAPRQLEKVSDGNGRLPEEKIPAYGYPWQEFPLPEDLRDPLTGEFPEDLEIGSETP